jgi:hypothetical protein
MSDGVQTLDLSSPHLAAEGATFLTDDLGNITEWDVAIFTQSFSPPGPLGGIYIYNVLSETPPRSAEDLGMLNPNIGGNISNSPGTWTIVPEPSTVTLVAIGLIGMLARRAGFMARSRLLALAQPEVV